MTNILIIKHGSLGDLIQCNGAIQDIRRSHHKSKIVLLTSKPYVDLMKSCPFVDEILIDKRSPRWNIFYLYKIKKKLSLFNFTHVFDLQNSNRTKFYRKFILRSATWSSTETTLDVRQKKSDFDEEPVLKRMEIQLKKSGVKVENVSKFKLNWATTNIKHITKEFFSGKFILIFPFSAKHEAKKWPYYHILITQLKIRYSGRYSIVLAPGPGEIKDSKLLNAQVLLDGEKPLNLNQLITLIKESSFVISNDTGPAHICSHLNKNGIALFGSHTTPEKVNIGSENFKSIVSLKLNQLTAEKVMREVKKILN